MPGCVDVDLLERGADPRSPDREEPTEVSRRIDGGAGRWDLRGTLPADLHRLPFPLAGLKPPLGAPISGSRCAAPWIDHLTSACMHQPADLG